MLILMIYAGHMSPGTLCEDHLSPLRDVVNAPGTFCETNCNLMIISDKVLTALGTLYKTHFISVNDVA